jgi:peptidoglycan/LPS O-acetylase OafA/YrhL
MNYRKEIDGLRALAVIPVILFHAGFETFSGGFIGVDVFFVISGYLITTIILEELGQNQFSLVNFYERRARRILPGLFFVMLVSLPAAYFCLLPQDIKDFSQSLVAVSFFISNIFFWSETGYFDTSAELKPLLHTWSLSVEEQFYMLFPLLLISCWKFRRYYILITLGVIFVISLSLAQWASYLKPGAAFFLLPTRGWELLLGTFAAFYLLKTNHIVTSKVVGEIAGWLGIALILFSVFYYSKTTPFPGIFALVPTTGAILVILFSRQSNSSGKFLSNKLLVGIGLISFGAYLWHQPIFAFVRAYTFEQQTTELIIILIALSFFLGFLSFKYIEKPFRSIRKFSRKKFFISTIMASAFFISIGIVGDIKNGFPGNQSLINNAISDWQYPGELTETNIDGYYKLYKDKPLDVLFFGDSHAEQYAPLTVEIKRMGLNVGFLTGGGCPPVPNLFDDLHPHCFDIFLRLNKILSIETNISQIIVSGCFNCYFIEQSSPTSNPSDKYNYYYFDEKNEIEKRESGQKLFFRMGKGQTEAFESLNSFLSELALKYKLILIGDNPASESFNPSIILNHKYRGDSIFFKSRYPTFSDKEFTVSREQIVIDNKLNSITPSNGVFISQIDVICPSGVCQALNNNGLPKYKDSNHMRPFFVKEIIGPNLITKLK